VIGYFIVELTVVLKHELVLLKFILPLPYEHTGSKKSLRPIEGFFRTIGGPRTDLRESPDLRYVSSTIILAQATHVIRGLFICEFVYSHWKKWSKMIIFQSKMDFLSANSRFAVQKDGSYLPHKKRETCISKLMLFQIKEQQQEQHLSYLISIDTATAPLNSILCLRESHPKNGAA
jgi:hypothetical protein